MKTRLAISLVVLALFGTAPLQASGIEISGQDESACTAGKNAVLVTVRGFSNNVGGVRVQLYRANESFLEKGEWLVRAERKRDGNATMRFCLPVPSAGRYGVAVRHDANGDGKSGWSDGAGFSRNPSLSLMSLKPPAAKVAFDIGREPAAVDIVMQYRSGLGIKPLK